MLHTVVLEHTLQDGSAHFDWMIEHPALAGEHRLLTFRTSGRPDFADGFEAERIGAHRAAYLTFEGEVSGGRGVVRRLAEGAAEWVELTDELVGVSIRWSEAGFRRYEGLAKGAGKWVFSATSE